MDAVLALSALVFECDLSPGREGVCRGALKRPGSGGGADFTGEWCDASTQEVSERAT